MYIYIQYTTTKTYTAINTFKVTWIYEYTKETKNEAHPFGKKKNINK